MRIIDNKSLLLKLRKPEVVLENIIRSRTGLNDTEEDIPLTQLLKFIEFLFSKTNSNIINNVTHQYGKNSAEKILNEAKQGINQARLNLSLDDNAYQSLDTINTFMDGIIINPRELITLFQIC